MGVVLKAEDTKLKRTVALKFPPPELTRNEETKQRFIQEARAASVLEHNNICNIHEINETEDGYTFIVMAYYEGETLKERIERGLLKVEEAIDIATQIAQGLAKAHAMGIVHRDIKPANVFLTSDGVVKIVDFGLAKLAGQVRITKTGTTVGTAAYMSPEQTRGEEVDRRTDIWSLSVVLYEMITGRLPFRGDYEQAVVYSILNEEPEPMTGLRTGVPVELGSIVNKAMAKNPDERYQHVEEMLGDLRSPGEASVSRLGKKNSAKKISRPLLGIVAIGLLLALAIVSYLLIHQGKEEFRITRTVPLTIEPGLEQDPAWSPEGTRIAYASDESGNMDIYVRQVAAGQRLNLTKDHSGYDGKPAWSPDGEWIAFVSERDGGGIYLIPALGGIPKRLLSLSFARSLSYAGSIPSVRWSPDGTDLVYATSGIVYTIPVTGGRPAPVPLPPTALFIGYSEPAWSPDGKRITYTDLVAAGVATSQIWSVQRDGADPFPITEGKKFDHSPVWSPDGGQLFFISDRGGSHDVWWVPVDTRGQPTGHVRPLTTGAGVGAIALSGDGTKLAYAKVVERSNICSIPIVPDRMFTLEDARVLTSENHYIELLSFSPDGNWIAFDSNRSGNQDIWIMRKDGSGLRQMTTNAAHDWVGSWAPDGKRIAFHSLRRGNRDLFVMPVAGGAVTPLTSHPAEDFMPAWSPDGEKIAFASNRGGAMDVWVMPSDGGEPQQLTFHTAPGSVCWSPDGEQLVFSSKRTGNGELFLIPAEGGDPVQLTQGMWLDITPFVWSLDGQTIYAWGLGGPDNEGANLWAVSAADGTARPLMDMRGSLKEPLTLSSDGERLYFTLWECVGDLWMAELSTGE